MLLMGITEIFIIWIISHFNQGETATRKGIHFIEKSMYLEQDIYFYFKEYIHLLNSRGSKTQGNLKF